MTETCWDSPGAVLSETVLVRPESHLGLHSRLDLAPKRLESRLSHHSPPHDSTDLKFS